MITQQTNFQSFATIEPETNVRKFEAPSVNDRFNSISTPSDFPIVSEDLNSISRPKFKETEEGCPHLDEDADDRKA
jgi:hypothetical protein